MRVVREVRGPRKKSKGKRLRVQGIVALPPRSQPAPARITGLDGAGESIFEALV